MTRRQHALLASQKLATLSSQSRTSNLRFPLTDILLTSYYSRNKTSCQDEQRYDETWTPSVPLHSLDQAPRAISGREMLLVIIIQIQPMLQYKNVYNIRTNIIYVLHAAGLLWQVVWSIYGVDNCMNKLCLCTWSTYVQLPVATYVHSYHPHSALLGYLLVTMHCCS